TGTEDKYKVWANRSGRASGWHYLQMNASSPMCAKTGRHGTSGCTICTETLLHRSLKEAPNRRGRPMGPESCTANPARTKVSSKSPLWLMARRKFWQVRVYLRIGLRTAMSCLIKRQSRIRHKTSGHYL